MDNNENVLFITDKKYIDYEIPGGVQICTAEFIKYFETAGYNLIIIKVIPNINLIKRLKLKLGIETYELYDSDSYISEIVKTINTSKIKFVLFNQLNVAHWATNIRKKLSFPIKCIGLSHGNESGDYLYEITKKNRIPTFLQTWRIGKLIGKEKLLFSSTLNAVITISKQDSFVNQWLGAKTILFLPRILEPNFIDWQPIENVIGFVGTLDHYPNFGGIELLADQLEAQSFKGELRLVGGPSSFGVKLADKYSFIQYLGVMDNDELQGEIAKWSVFINPVFWYARGSSTKVAQIISWGLPVISTKAGVRGYELTKTAFLTQEDSPENLASLVIKNLKSLSELKKLKSISEDNALNYDLAFWSFNLKAFLEKI